MPGLRIVLVSPRNPLNIGAAARAMSNFGFTDLHLISPYDLAFREARSAVNSSYILQQAQVHNTLDQALADCTLVVGTTSVGHRDFHVPLYTLETASVPLRQAASSSQAALLFGSEKFGLSNSDLSYCNWLLRIPSREEHGSMNLGQAVAICLYELIRDESAPAELHARGSAIDAVSAERLTELLFDAAQRSGYVQERTAESSLLKLRRLVRRLDIPAADSETWLGLLRQILWKLKQKSPDAGDGNLSAPETPAQTREAGSR